MCSMQVCSWLTDLEERSDGEEKMQMRHAWKTLQQMLCQPHYDYLLTSKTIPHSICDVPRSSTWTPPLQWVMWSFVGRGQWWETRFQRRPCFAVFRIWTLNTPITPATPEVCLCYSLLIQHCVHLCVCVSQEEMKMPSDELICLSFPQVLWILRWGITWSCWSLVAQPICPWMKTPPSWVLSNYIKVCHLILDPRDAFVERAVCNETQCKWPFLTLGVMK